MPDKLLYSYYVMDIVKKKNNHWICYPANKTEFDELVTHLRKNLGRSHWSVFNHTWATRQITPEEFLAGRYQRVVEVKHKNVMIAVQLIWG